MLDETLLHDRLRRVRLLVMDVDGILTDGGVYLGGEVPLKRFSVRDRAGIKYLLRAGIGVAFVSGHESLAVAQLAADLGVEEVHQRALRKWPVVEALLERLGISLDEMAYMGDDLIDLPVLLRAGLALTVPEAQPEVLERVQGVTRNGGGHGAVREVAEAILRAQGYWAGLLANYLRVEIPESESSGS